MIIYKSIYHKLLSPKSSDFLSIITGNASQLICAHFQHLSTSISPLPTFYDTPGFKITIRLINNPFRNLRKTRLTNSSDASRISRIVCQQTSRGCLPKTRKEGEKATLIICIHRTPIDSDLTPLLGRLPSCLFILRKI